MPAHIDIHSPHGAPAASAAAQPVAAAASYPGRIRITAIVSGALFVLLMVVNVIRTLHHAMWRDEMQIFMLALYSSSPGACYLS